MDIKIIYAICITVAFLIVTFWALHERDFYKTWRAMSKILAENCEKKDEVITQQQACLSEKDKTISTLKDQLANCSRTITWYQERTKIGEYYIDEYVEKKLVPELVKEVSKKIDGKSKE